MNLTTKLFLLYSRSAGFYLRGITWQSKFNFSLNKNVMFLRIMFVENYLYLEGETYLFSMICQKMC